VKTLLNSILCLAFIFSAPAALAQKVGEIDASQKDKFKTRYEAKNSTVFGFGPGFGTNLNTTGMLYALTFGYEWEVGANAAVLAQLGGVFGSSAAYTDLNIGAKYYFLDTDISPFVKGGLGFGAAKGSDLDSAAGFGGIVGAGMTLFRTSSVHLDVSANYSTLFATNQKGAPGVGSLQLQISF
jgi:hypothetical protein